MDIVYRVHFAHNYWIIALSPTEIKSLLGDNNLWADTGDTTAVYRADITMYINRKIAEAVSALS